MAFLPSFKRIVFQQDLEDQMLPFTFDLHPSKLVYVDCAKQFDDMKLFFEKSCIIGIDTETKPTFLKKEPGDKQKQTSIIQIAARNRQGGEMTYIIDLQELSKHMVLMKGLDVILLDVFTRTDCYKIGQGLDRDFRELSAAFTYMECFKLVCSVIETTEFVKCIEPEVTQMVSLKYLVQKYLNCNLVKTQQMSNWGRRPLAPEQIHYAACDALVLLRLYDAMLCEAEEAAAGGVALSCSDSTDGETVCSDGTYYSTGTLTSSSSLHATRKADTPSSTQPFDISSILSTIDTTVKRISRHSSRNSLCSAASSAASSEQSEKGELVAQYTKAWATPAAREWYAKQLVAGTKAAVADSSSTVSGETSAVAESTSFTVNSAEDNDDEDDDDDEITIPLPTGQGVHKHFDATPTASPSPSSLSSTPLRRKKKRKSGEKQKQEKRVGSNSSGSSSSSSSSSGGGTRLTLIKRQKI